MSSLISIQLIENDLLSISKHIIRVSDIKIIFQKDDYYLKDGLNHILIDGEIFVQYKKNIYMIDKITILEQKVSADALSENIFHANTILDQYDILSNKRETVNNKKTYKNMSNKDLLPSKRMFDMPKYSFKDVKESNEIKKEYIQVSKSPLDDIE